MVELRSFFGAVRRLLTPEGYARSIRQDFAMPAPSILESGRLPSSIRLFAVVGCQRTGTQLLREVLNSNNRLALVAEPFTPYPAPIFWHNCVRQLPPEKYPTQTVSDAQALLDRYMSVLHRDVYSNSESYGTPKRKLTALGLDVKYNQLRCAGPVYTDLLERPFLIKYFRERQIQIIHMVRKNLAHAALSMIIANERKIWHNQDGRKFEGRYRISPEELLAYMTYIQNERDEFLRLTQDLNVQTFSYEDLVQDVSSANEAGLIPMNTRVLQPIAECLNVPNQFERPQGMHKVINRPYSEILDNFDEIVAALKSSQFSEFTSSLLPTNVAA